MWRVLGNFICDLGLGQIVHFLLNAFSPFTVGRSNFKLSWCIGHSMCICMNLTGRSRSNHVFACKYIWTHLLGNILYDLDPKVREGSFCIGKPDHGQRKNGYLRLCTIDCTV